jgi:hypothetical protein
MQDIHSINLLKRSVLSLNYKEVHDEEQSETASREDKTVEIVNVVSDKGGEERDKEVKEPVGCGRESYVCSSIAC